MIRETRKGDVPNWYFENVTQTKPQVTERT